MLTYLQLSLPPKHNFLCAYYAGWKHISPSFLHLSGTGCPPFLHSSLPYVGAVNNANNFRTFTLTGNCCFSFNRSYKDSCSAQFFFFLMCRNEVLQRLLFNLWGIELDVPPIFTEMEMKPAWMRACLSLVLIGWLSCLFIASLLLMCFMQERQTQRALTLSNWAIRHQEAAALNGRSYDSGVLSLCVTRFGPWHFNYVIIEYIIATPEALPVFTQPLRSDENGGHDNFSKSYAVCRKRHYFCMIVLLGVKNAPNERQFTCRLPQEDVLLPLSWTTKTHYINAMEPYFPCSPLWWSIFNNGFPSASSQKAATRSLGQMKQKCVLLDGHQTSL